MKKAPEKFRFAAMAVDVPVFGLVGEKLYCLVSTVNRPPHYLNKFGFLGGMIKSSETAEEAVCRVLFEKGNIKDLYLEQLYTFSAVERDKRNRVVSVAYIGLVPPEKVLTYKQDEASFKPIDELSSLAYDHDEILKVSLTRLRGKLSYTTIAQFLLPKSFTLTELQTVYEILKNTKLDKRNFRKKILALDILKDTGKSQEGVQNRPATLYSFKSKKLEELNLVI